MPGDRFIELAQSEDRHVLDVLFRDAREAVTVQDRVGHLVYANDRAAQLAGLQSGVEMVATPGPDLFARFEMIDETGNPFDLDLLPGRLVLAGSESPEVTIGYRMTGSRTVRWSRVNASPIKNDAGEVVWAINFFLDISEQMRERESERVLVSVAEVLAGSLTVEENLTALANLLVPEFADWCGIHLIDDRGDLVPRAIVFPEMDQAKALVAIADRGRIPLGSDRLQMRVMKTGRPEVIDQIGERIKDGKDHFSPDAADLVKELKLEAVICLPLGSRKSGLGTMTLARSRPNAAFEENEVALLRRIAETAGVALANARLYELEHETAEALRAGLTPTDIPAFDGVELAARYVPLATLSRLGGDFYDVLPLSPTNLVLLVGDIEGKGIPAAAAVGLARDTLRATIKLESDPKIVLAQLNDALREQPHPRMCTLAYIRMERQDEGFDARITLAGHPPPLLLTAQGESSLLGIPCPPTGVLPSVEPHEVLASLSPGDTLLLYTDGFAVPPETPVETLGRFAAGGEAEPLDLLLDRLLADLRASAPSIRDDVLLLAMRVA